MTEKTHEKPSTELVKGGPPDAIEKFLLDRRSDQSIDEGEAMQRGVLERLMRAETAEDILAADAIESTQMLIGQTVEFLKAEVRDSDYGDGSVYLLCDAIVVSDGERRTTVSTGSGPIMQKLARAAMIDAWPVTATIVEKRSKRNPEHTFLNIVLPGPRDSVTRQIEGQREAIQTDE